MIVYHGRQPRPRFLAAGVEDQNVELGMIGLPDGVRPIGAVPVHQLELVAESGGALMRERQHRRFDLAYDVVDTAVGWRPPSLCDGKSGDAAVDGGNRWRRLEKCHALDQLHQLLWKCTLARFRSQRSFKRCRPAGPIAGKPAPGGTDRDAGVGRNLRQRQFVVEMLAKHVHAPRDFGAARLRLWIIRHGDLLCP